MRASIDGQLVPAEEVERSGLLDPTEAAEAPLELVRQFRGRLELVGEHVRRLLRREDRRGRSSGASSDEMAARTESWLRELAAANGIDGVYAMVAAPDRTGAANPAARPVVMIWSEQDDGAVTERLAQGIRLDVTTRARDPDRRDAEKTLGSWTAARQARQRGSRRGFDEALRVDADERLLGAQGANVFLARLGEWCTPALVPGVFAGIGRRIVLRAATDFGVAVRERTVDASELSGVDDLFLASSARGIVSVASVAGRSLSPPVAGSARRRLVPQLRLRWHELAGARFLPT